MNKKQETELLEVARKVKALRECATKADAMIRSWASHKPKSKDVYISLSDNNNSRWHVGVNLSTDVVQNELIPILKRIRDKANEELKALDMPGRE